MAQSKSLDEPARVGVVGSGGEKLREMSLDPEVFAVRPNDHLVYEAVKEQRAGARRGTHKTKTRAEVSGTGAKPWRQKGTGRARVGEARNPLWRHGGTVHGPQPRSYALKMPKKARRAALRSALSQRVSDGSLRIVEAFPIQPGAEGERPRLAKQMKELLQRLQVAGKAVIVDHQPSDALVLSGRNLPGVRVVDDSHLTVYDVLDCRTLLVSQAAIQKLEERLAP